MAFETRMEAIADSVQAAVPLAFPLIVEAPRGSRDAESVTIGALKSDAAKVDDAAHSLEETKGIATNRRLGEVVER